MFACNENKLPVLKITFAGLVANGFEPAFWINVEPFAKITEPAVPEAVNTFPVQLTSCVNTAPLLKVIPEASPASKVWAPAE